MYTYTCIIYICVCIHTCVYIYIYIYVCIYIYTHIYTNKPICVYSYIYIYICHTYIYIYIYIYMYTHMRICTHIYIRILVGEVVVRQVPLFCLVRCAMDCLYVYTLLFVLRSRSLIVCVLQLLQFSVFQVCLQ